MSALMDGYVFLSVDSRGQFQEFLVIAEELIDLEVHRWLVRTGLVVRVGVLLLIDVHALADFEQIQETVPHTLGWRGRREDGGQDDVDNLFVDQRLGCDFQLVLLLSSMSIFIKYFLYKLSVNVEIIAVQLPQNLLYYHVDHLDFELAIFFVFSFVYYLGDRVGHAWEVGEFDHLLHYLGFLAEKEENLVRLDPDNCVKYFDHIVHAVLVGGRLIQVCQ